ncbi:hypothetical protein NKI77_06740 [Mesorhizobium opportunistum]|uniref:hypothetical protein n=1 Tax=Mesorhizobium opportunistum TaxID=593909 RepID=UPI00333B585A
MPLRIAPASIKRAIEVFSQFVFIAEAQGYRTEAMENGLALIVDEESIAFSLEEKSQKVPHEPTAAELKEWNRRASLGYASRPWPNYDYAPSGRLAIIIDANAYSGLRRTYADGKTRTLENMLPEVLAGFAEHAAMKKERRRAEEARARAWREAEAQRLRRAAFEAREKRRMEFVDAVHEQLIERAKLSSVLSHLENMAAEDACRVGAMVAWMRRRLLQIDVLIGPRFLDISSRSAKVGFEEPCTGSDDEEERDLGYLPPIELEYWSIDEEKGLATATTRYDWIKESGLDGNQNSDRNAEPQTNSD